jgi:hypothetical protein
VIIVNENITVINNQIINIRQLKYDDQAVEHPMNPFPVLFI